jgi:Domain of unknown function (DUF4124)
MDMDYRKTFSICLVALAVHSAAWAEIYETTDAEGNPEFTDSPAADNSEVIDLQQTNVADAPKPEQQSQEVSQPNTGDIEQTPRQNNNTLIIHDANDDQLYDDELARERALERTDPAVRHEVGDSESQMPHEVGDSESQMPREIGDSESQMSREVGADPARTGAHRR